MGKSYLRCIRSVGRFADLRPVHLDRCSRRRLLQEGLKRLRLVLVLNILSFTFRQVGCIEQLRAEEQGRLLGLRPQNILHSGRLVPLPSRPGDQNAPPSLP